MIKKICFSILAPINPPLSDILFKQVNSFCLSAALCSRLFSFLFFRHLLLFNRRSAAFPASSLLASRIGKSCSSPLLLLLLLLPKSNRITFLLQTLRLMSGQDQLESVVKVVSYNGGGREEGAVTRIDK